MYYPLKLEYFVFIFTQLAYIIKEMFVYNQHAYLYFNFFQAILNYVIDEIFLIILYAYTFTHKMSQEKRVNVTNDQRFWHKGFYKRLADINQF